MLMQRAIKLLAYFNVVVTALMAVIGGSCVRKLYMSDECEKACVNQSNSINQNQSINQSRSVAKEPCPCTGVGTGLILFTCALSMTSALLGIYAVQWSHVQRCCSQTVRRP